MHMRLASGLKGASFDTKINSIACWEHIEPENIIHYIAIINTSRGPVFTMDSLDSTQLTPCMVAVV